MQTNWRLSGKQLELMIGRNWMEGAGKFHTPRVINCWWLFIYLEIKLRNIVNQYFQFDIWDLLLIWWHIYIILQNFLLIFFVRHLLSSVHTSLCDRFFFLFLNLNISNYVLSNRSRITKMCQSTICMYFRGFTKFGIKVAWRLQFLE